MRQAIRVTAAPMQGEVRPASVSGAEICVMPRTALAHEPGPSDGAPPGDPAKLPMDGLPARVDARLPIPEHPAMAVPVTLEIVTDGDPDGDIARDGAGIAADLGPDPARVEDVELAPDGVVVFEGDA